MKHKFNGKERYSDIVQMTEELDAKALKGLIRILACLLNEKEPIHEKHCPICVWVEGNYEKDYEKESEIIIQPREKNHARGIHGGQNLRY